MAVDDFGEHVREVSFRIDAVELAGLDQRSDDSPMLGSAVRAGEKRIFPIERNGTDRALDDVGVDLYASVVDEARQAIPAGERVADRFGELGLLADQREFFAQPRLERRRASGGISSWRAARRSSALRPRISLSMA